MPSSALEVMLSSLSDSTKSQYTSSFKQWWQYCQSRGIDPLVIRVYDVLDFLSESLNKGSSYGTLNNHRSALSLISGNKVGQDELIKRFMKGAFRRNPSFPRYNITWNPNTVLDYLAGMYPHSTLNLEQITKKLVMLLALATGQRCQTLSLIKIPNIKVHASRIIITITDLVKTSGISKPQPLLNLPFFREHPCICTADTLLDYMNVTSPLRTNCQDNRLILTIKRPNHAATSQTIGRWIKQTLAASGIDTALFSAHSTRHASTSAAARAGVSIDVIRRTACWSDRSLVFANFYNRPIVEPESNFVNVLFN